VPLPPPSGGIIEVERTVNASGNISVGNHVISAGSPLAGQRVTVRLDGPVAHILANATTISFRQISEAQRIAELAGTVTRLEASGTYAGHGLRGLDSGSAREQETYRVQPNELRALGTGECYVIHHGAAARVSVGLPAGAFGVYPVPAWLDQGRPGQSQLRPPVEPGQVR
jgi:hypothetical protein